MAEGPPPSLLPACGAAVVVKPAGNTSNSHVRTMSFDTQMTLALLQELLLALRANDPDGFKTWLPLGIERLGKPPCLWNTAQQLLPTSHQMCPST